MLRCVRFAREDVTGAAMRSGLKWTKRTVAVLAILAVVFFSIRIYDAERGPALKPWHTYYPEELSAKALDRTDWPAYLAAEAKAFEAIRAEVTQKLTAEDRAPINRYFEASPVYPPRLPNDWNRSYVLEPNGSPVGAAVFLHGLTDSPYSLRHIARRYRDHGFFAIAIRLPGHGTTPAALTSVEWEDWSAATRLAVREARRRVPPSSPLHLIGFSNGGALAMKYALDAIGDERLAQPTRLVLISPMIGITEFARFAGLAGLPAVLPAFAKSAWLARIPEFNPFRYNSFPVNGARQSFRLTQALQDQLARYEREGRLVRLPPILTFQSVMDFTVSTPAIVSALYARLPPNGSELVLFDVNRTIKFGPLLRPAADTALARILPGGPRPYRTTVVANADDHSDQTVERTNEAGATTEQTRDLGLSYPPGLNSLSHVALPFPMSDPLYGLTPDATENYGIALGALAPRGERNVLIASLDALLRASSNPFFEYMIGRIEEALASRETETADAPGGRDHLQGQASPSTSSSQ
jgi:alpha-beta hydrolase superfamily lysophospholipase